MAKKSDELVTTTTLNELSTHADCSVVDAQPANNSAVTRIIPNLQ